MENLLDILEKREDITIDNQRVSIHLYNNEVGYLFGLELPRISLDNAEIKPSTIKVGLYSEGMVSPEEHIKLHCISRKISNMHNMKLGKFRGLVSLEKTVCFHKDVDDVISALRIYDTASNSSEIEQSKDKCCYELKKSVEKYIEAFIGDK